MIEGVVTIMRYDPASDREPRPADYPFPFETGMSVLDVVRHVAERVDAGLGFDYCCRNSHCGLCGLMIDGTPGLACREVASDRLRLEPLSGLPVVLDLVVDRGPYEERLLALRLFLERAGDAPHLPERVGRVAHERFKSASRCVDCLCCLAACPVFGERPHDFLGPTGFALLARHAFDPRDRLDRGLVARTSGIEHCTQCGRCSAVCPHDVGPAEVIEELRRH